MADANPACLEFPFQFTAGNTLEVAPAESQGKRPGIIFCLADADQYYDELARRI
jgi:hypothetical protein